MVEELEVVEGVVVSPCDVVHFIPVTITPRVVSDCLALASVSSSYPGFPGCPVGGEACRACGGCPSHQPTSLDVAIPQLLAGG